MRSRSRSRCRRPETTAATPGPRIALPPPAPDGRRRSPAIAGRTPDGGGPRPGAMSRRQREDLPQPSSAFGDVTALLPEAPQRARGILRAFDMTRLDGPAERLADVPVLDVASIQPFHLVLRDEVRLRLHRHVQVVP